VLNSSGWELVAAPARNTIDAPAPPKTAVAEPSPVATRLWRGKQANLRVGATVEEPLHAGRDCSELTGHVQRAFLYVFSAILVSKNPPPFICGLS